jgi:hypothetical protein
MCRTRGQGPAVSSGQCHTAGPVPLIRPLGTFSRREKAMGPQQIRLDEEMQLSEFQYSTQTRTFDGFGRALKGAGARAGAMPASNSGQLTDG